MQQKSITYQNTTIGYFTEGSGFPLVFIPGFPADHHIWNEFVEPFTKTNKVILPDLPGFGASALPSSPVSMVFYADCVKAILDAENISSCAIIGHSMGGYATLNFAEHYPQYLAGFGLFHSTAYADDDAKKEGRTKTAENVRAGGHTTLVTDLMGKLFGPGYSSTQPDRVEYYRSTALKNASQEGVAQAVLAMRDRADTTDVLRKATVPVLFIIGKDDKIIDPVKTTELTHLPNTSVISILEGVCHMGMIESPEKARKSVNEFLAAMATAPGNR